MGVAPITQLGGQTPKVRETVSQYESAALAAARLALSIRRRTDSAPNPYRGELCSRLGRVGTQRDGGIDVASLIQSCRPTYAFLGGNVVNRTLLASSVLAMFISVPLMAADGSVDVTSFSKQLSGPASEIASMRAASPVDATIHSRTALLPVHFGAAGSSERSWQATLPVENGKLRFLVFEPADTNWQVDLVTASGREVSAASQASRVLNSEFGIERSNVPVTRYDYDNLQGDNWTLKLRSASGAKDGFILIEGDEATELASWQTHSRQLVGQRLGLTALLTTSADDKVRVGKTAGRINQAIIRVTAPDKTTATYPMFDDGRHDDGVAGDGLFGGDFPADMAGDYTAQVEARGINQAGKAFVRTAEHLLPVVDISLELSASRAVAVASGNERLSIRIPVTARSPGQHYRAIGEIWGTDADGKSVAVAWLGGMVTHGYAQQRYACARLR